MARYADTPHGGGGGRKPKIFVLDTNIILHDHKAIRKFQDNDLVIPIAVIEELDKFKKGNDNLAFNARGFMRDIDRITDGKSFGKYGVPIGRGLGNIRIDPGHPFPESMKGMFYDDIPDHRILATAIWTRDNNPDRFVALVTKDINLRMKAKAAGMEVQDYLTDRIDEDKIENSNKEVQFLGGLSPEALQSLAYSQETAVDWKAVCKVRPKANQLYKIKGQDSTICARFDENRDKIVLVKNKEAYGIRPRNDEQKFALDACLNPAIQLVSMTGGAGTGKTLLALAAAIEQAKDFDQIILTRPTIVLGNQDIGFIPGDQKAKMSPFVQPLMDNLNVIKAQFRPSSKEALRIEAMLKEEKLLISPLAYIRGRSLGRVFLICDEVYREFCYDDKFGVPTMAHFRDIDENLVIIDSASKRFSACGARVGCVVTRNKELQAALLKFCQSRLSVATIDQIGAAALYTVDPAFFRQSKEEYRRRRDTVISRLRQIPGVVVEEPMGAFYVMASLPVDDADRFQHWLLDCFDDKGDTVMFAPGAPFYETPGKGINEVRIAYVLKQEDLARAMEVLAKGIARYQREVMNVVAPALG